tara:strand:+ start:875 stop:1684 length:810 start_codon:yes stop_codon:yes gene_type:complete
MTRKKIYDCITFFDENLLANLRFEILQDVVDYFVVCESEYDHKRQKKKINFKLKNKKFDAKVIHVILSEPFPDNLDSWGIEAFQRDKIFDTISNADADDLIMYSDSDEIPNPNLLKNMILKKKYGIFLQKFFAYKFNIFNKHETPWEGTRICKKKDLNSITYLRKKIKTSNFKKPFWKFNIQKNIESFENGGWHFNNLYTPEKISVKLKTYQHTEYAKENFSSPEIIKMKIKNLEDLFERGNKYEIVKIDNSFPDYLIKNKDLFSDFIQ